jgi:cupin superfamily acireductone dioxygenase involved in methionine salvage
MMRMFEVFADKYFRAVRVFRETDKAESWLAEQRAAQDSAPKLHPRGT